MSKAKRVFGPFLLWQGAALAIAAIAGFINDVDTAAPLLGVAVCSALLWMRHTD